MLKGPKTTRVTIAPFMAPNENIDNRSPKLEKLQPFVRVRCAFYYLSKPTNWK